MKRKISLITLSLLLMLLACYGDAVYAINLKVKLPETQRNLKQNNSQLAGYKKVYTLTDKNGRFLGDVYVKIIKKDIFSSLIIAKEKDNLLDTLYFVDKHRMMNPKEIEMKVQVHLYGYKFLLKKGDYIVIDSSDENGNSYSDPINIEWNYKDKMFEIPKEP